MICKDEMRTKLTLLSSLFSLIVTMGVNFILSSYIVSNLSETANGFVQLANNFTNYASLLIIALNSMASRHITIEYYRSNMKECEKIYSSLIIGNIIIEVFLATIGTIFICNLEKIINIQEYDVYEIKLLFSFIFINYLLSQIISIFSIAIYIHNKMYLYYFALIFSTLFNALLIWILFSLGKPRVYYIGLVACILTVFLLPYYWIIKKRELKDINFSFKLFNFKAIVNLISSGIWNTINQCGNIFMTGFDLLLANQLIGSSPMGVLAIAKIIPSCITQIASSINTSFLPEFTRFYSKGDKQALLESVNTAMKYSTLLSSLPIAILFVFGNTFYHLWMPSLDAKELNTLAIITCFPLLFLSGVQVLYNIYTITNKLKVNSVTVLLGGIANVILVLILLKYTSLKLVAVAGVSSIVSLVRNLIVTVPYTSKLLEQKWYFYYKNIAISLICFILNFIICCITKRVFSPANWSMLILSIIFSGILGLGSTSFFLLNKNEKKSVLCRILRR